MPRFLSRWFRIDWTGALTAPAPIGRDSAEMITRLMRHHIGRVTHTPPFPFVAKP